MKKEEPLFKDAKPVFVGKKVKAEYITSDEPFHCHNPFIEALPLVLTKEEAIIKMRRYPVFYEYERSWTVEQRLHAVQRVSSFIEPTTKFLELERRFSRMIRNGYFARNPIDSEWVRQMRKAFKNLDTVSDKDLPVIRSSASGFVMLGTSGMGKSTSVESVLSLYPQVIDHKMYNKVMFIRRQLVWLKLECPKDGSIKALVLNFFYTVDIILGTNYYQKFCRSQKSAESMIPDMAFLSANFGLGVLVIDEVQRLNSASSGGRKQMYDFFTELINSIGVPVVLIGTFGAMKHISKLFSTARRGTGQGDMMWSNYVQDAYWDYFIETLWYYQWTNVPTMLTQELIDVLYEESQGITDIAVKLYMLSQWAVIGGKREQITPHLIKDIAKECLKLLKPVLDALKAGNNEVLMGYDDVFPESHILEEYFAKASERISLAGTLNTLKNQRNLVIGVSPSNAEFISPVIRIAQWLVDAGIDEKIAFHAATISLNREEAGYDITLVMNSAFDLSKQIIKEEKLKTDSPKKKGRVKKQPLSPHDLRETTNETDSYQALREADLLKGTFD